MEDIRIILREKAHRGKERMQLSATFCEEGESYGDYIAKSQRVKDENGREVYILVGRGHYVGSYPKELRPFRVVHNLKDVNKHLYIKVKRIAQREARKARRYGRKLELADLTQFPSK